MAEYIRFTLCLMFINMGKYCHSFYYRGMGVSQKKSVKPVKIDKKLSVDDLLKLKLFELSG